MMAENIETFLEQYLHSRGLTRRHPHVRYVQFLEADESDDDHFSNLLTGRVSAGFRVKKWYIEQSFKWGEAEHIIIMTDFYGVAKACAKIKYVETILYKNMTETLAEAIGYGDGSLAAWKQRSHNIINLDCITANVKFSGQTELLITHFDMLYPLLEADCIMSNDE